MFCNILVDSGLTYKYQIRLGVSVVTTTAAFIHNIKHGFKMFNSVKLAWVLARSRNVQQSNGRFWSHLQLSD